MGAVGSSSQDLLPTPTLIFKDSGKQYATSRPIFYEQVMDSSSSDFSPSSDSSYSESSYFSSESSSSSNASGPKSASVTKVGSIAKSTSTTSPALTTKGNSSSIWNTTKATNYGLLEDDRFVFFVGCGIAGLFFMLLLLIAVLVGHRRHRRRKNSSRGNVTVINLNTQPSRGCYATGVMNDRSHNFVNTRPSCPPVPQQDKQDECYYEAISSALPTPSIYEQPRETATYNNGCTMSFQSANVRTNAQNTQDDYLIPHQNPSTRGQYVASDSPYLAVSD